MDVAQCVETMRSDLGEMFDDPRLSSVAKGKRGEIEAGFMAMRSIFATLSAVRLEYETVKQQAETASVSSSSNGSSHAVPEAPAVEGAATVRAGEATVHTVETGAAPTTMETNPVAATAPVPDGPTQERTANRERTPPPGSRAKAIAKMSDAEIAGPRKAKGTPKASA